MNTDYIACYCHMFISDCFGRALHVMCSSDANPMPEVANVTPFKATTITSFLHFTQLVQRKDILCTILHLKIIKVCWDFLRTVPRDPASTAPYCLYGCMYAQSTEGL